MCALAEKAEYESSEIINAINNGKNRAFYIVGMGGSAGSLESFEEFFKNIPADTGLAFVVVSHLDPIHKGIMPELLQRFTAMKVSQAEDGDYVQPNSVYVIPPGKDLSMLHGTLQLLEPAQARGFRMPIDFFFRHLAEDQGERAIGIIFSGMGTDGTLGLKAIKEKQGMVMVEDPASSKYDAMPKSAINAGLVDYVAPANKLPEKLLGYVNHLYKVTGVMPAPPSRGEGQTFDSFQKIFLLVRSKTGADFSLYKENTTRRRIERRMTVHQITDINQYVQYIQNNPEEIDFLFKEFLIGVTSFFRDSESFEALKKEYIPGMLKNKKDGESMRVWVVGCSTGEEAYSIAILFRECLDDPNVKSDLKVQIYATDLDKEAIDLARQGTYPANIAQDVSEERLKRFFIKKDDSRFQIKSEVREMVVFAVQNVLTDPPFTRLDLLSCRNLLIYLTTDTQKKLLALFYFSLNQAGVLFLGSSESMGSLPDLFKPMDKKWKIFERKETSLARGDLVEFPASLLPCRVRMHDNVAAPKDTDVNITEVAQKLIIQTVAPPVVLINRDGDIVYTTRRTGNYLEPAVGKANLNIHAMAREGLGPELSIAIRKATADKTKVESRGIRVKTNGSWQLVNLTVSPIDQPKPLAGLLMVQFEDAAEPFSARPSKKGSRSVSRSASRLDAINRDLEKELQATKEQLQSVIEESQSSEEELRSASEEMQSINEELQSTNEEMVTSKEELQSLNEELTTLNAELQAKNDELTEVNSDMRNLLNSTQVPTVFLDNNLKIRRFTPYATKIFNLMPIDVGRPITDISSKLHYTGIAQDIADVLQTLVTREAQVQADDGSWYQMKILPYRTVDNIIDGVVIAFSDITALKELEETLRVHEEETLIRQVIDNWPGAIFIYDLAERRNVFVSLTASSMLGYPKDMLENANDEFWRALYHPDDASRLVDRDRWLASAKEGDILQREYRIKRSDGQWRWFVDRMAVLGWTCDHKPARILEVLEDITEQRHAEQLEESLYGMTMRAEYAEEIIRTVHEPLVVLDDELRVVFANPSFYRMFQATPEETEGEMIHDLGNGQWDIPALRQLLGEVLPKSAKVDDFLVEHDFPRIGHKEMLLNAQRIGAEASPKHLILLAIEDITDRKAKLSTD
jgi:two-component system CheB/CheR fusion protein